MQVERFIASSYDDIGRDGGMAKRKRGDMCSERLQRIGRLGIVILEQKVSDPIVERIV